MLSDTGYEDLIHLGYCTIKMLAEIIQDHSVCLSRLKNLVGKS